ncbi:hypothetical protein [Haloplanus natans]|uniref:hypothetical protein n=1 Tax=Haloplanus natans TaxID=376171 RepID=UPI0006783065|nr:hypothetical protein [Haloplanus natans]
MSQSHPETKQEQPSIRNVEPSASFMADQLCQGFINHDQRKREEAVEAFAAVDSLQFRHLDEDEVHCAAVGYVDALWAKDEVEDSCRIDGEIDPNAIVEADWSSVREAFRRRAEAAGIDPKYADLTTEAWVQHKSGGDYWTPTMHAQMLELRAALQDQAYPDKPRSGQGGFGPEPVQYALGIEYHDIRRWEAARNAMIPYFQHILDAHE